MTAKGRSPGASVRPQARAPRARGAFDAMGSGEVDLNCVREHHSLRVEETLGTRDAAKPPAAPAGRPVAPAE